MTGALDHSAQRRHPRHLVLEVSDTALAVMKCARRRMNAWRFTAPVGGPVEVEYDYEFSGGEAPAAVTAP